MFSAANVRSTKAQTVIKASDPKSHRTPARPKAFCPPDQKLEAQSLAGNSVGDFREKITLEPFYPTPAVALPDPRFGLSVQLYFLPPTFPSSFTREVPRSVGIILHGLVYVRLTGCKPLENKVDEKINSVESSDIDLLPETSRDGVAKGVAINSPWMFNKINYTMLLQRWQGFMECY